MYHIFYSGIFASLHNTECAPTKKRKKLKAIPNAYLHFGNKAEVCKECKDLRSRRAAIQCYVNNNRKQLLLS